MTGQKELPAVKKVIVRGPDIQVVWNGVDISACVESIESDSEVFAAKADLIIRLRDVPMGGPRR